MKSRTSYFDKAVLRKNMTRFAPAWGLYLLGLLMVLGLLASESGGGASYASALANSLLPFAVVNFGYGFLNAQLLFGDLYNARMCNALHALPLRREGWFLTHVASGLLFQLLPNLVMTFLSLLLSGNLWQIPLLWLAVMTMQYLFFFGVATLSAYLVGNRFAMGLVYIILNGFSVIALWLSKSIYEPYLYGILIREDSFYRFSPVVKLAGFQYIQVEYHKANGLYNAIGWELAEGWGYLAVCVALGVLAMGLALLCYRKRHLECAGDFVAVKGLSPVFLVLYTLCGGACCHGFFDLFLGDESFVYLLLGLAIGFFTGLMLLERQLRVFRWKRILAFGVLLAAFGVSVLACQLDLFGFVRWVPKAEAVKSVTISTGSSYVHTENRMLLEGADVEAFLEVHHHGVEHRNEGSDGLADVRLMVTYTMKNGQQRTRNYFINVDSQPGQQLKKWLSSEEVILGAAAQWGTLTAIEFYDDVGTEVKAPGAIREFLEALRADCALGVMAQDRNFYDQGETYYFGLRYRDPDGLMRFKELRLWEGCVNSVKWMEEYGIEFEKYK